MDISILENTSDVISRQAAIDVVTDELDMIDHVPQWVFDRLEKRLKQLPSAQLGTNLASLGTDCISRQEAISAICNACGKIDCDKMDKCEKLQLSPANISETSNSSDTISRRQAIDALDVLCQEHRYRIPGKRETYSEYNEAWQDALDRAEGAIGNLPSAQPERTCVNCGRTVNNGGWYADGGTRCPIEEHYALPKDGYCHLWEKRNVTDDNYPERREE